MLSCIFGTLGKLLEEKHLFRSCQRGGATWIFCPTTILIELYTEPKGRAWQHTRHTPMTHHDRASSAELPRHVSTLPAPCVDVPCPCQLRLDARHRARHILKDPKRMVISDYGNSQYNRRKNAPEPFSSISGASDHNCYASAPASTSAHITAS